MESLYLVLINLIERGQTEGLQEKIDVFFAVGRLSQDQYEELTESVTPRQDNNPS
jgi:hypothetical protein